MVAGLYYCLRCSTGALGAIHQPGGDFGNSLPRLLDCSENCEKEVVFWYLNRFYYTLSFSIYLFIKKFINYLNHLFKSLLSYLFFKPLLRWCAVKKTVIDGNFYALLRELIAAICRPECDWNFGKSNPCLQNCSL